MPRNTYRRPEDITLEDSDLPQEVLDVIKELFEITISNGIDFCLVYNTGDEDGRFIMSTEETVATLFIPALKMFLDMVYKCGDHETVVSFRELFPSFLEYMEAMVTRYQNVESHEDTTNPSIN